MKKAIIVLLSMSLAFQSVFYAQEPANRATRLQRLKQTLGREWREYTKCIKRDENCDPKRKKILYTASAIVAAVVLAAAGGVTWKLTRKKKDDVEHGGPKEFGSEQIAGGMPEEGTGGKGSEDDQPLEVRKKKKEASPSGAPEISEEELAYRLAEGEISGEEEPKDQPASPAKPKETKPLFEEEPDEPGTGELQKFGLI